MFTASTAFVCGGLIATLSGTAQPPDVRLAMSSTLREALSRAGFVEALSSTGAPDLDRALTDSAFRVSSEVFAAAYFFADEPKDGASHLRVSRYDRRSARWTQSPTLDDGVGYGITSVDLTPLHVLVSLLTPSASGVLVLDSSTLERVASLDGFDPRPLPDGSIVFTENMVHFAPMHQERLQVFDPHRRQELPVFPGKKESVLAVNFRRTIQRIYAELPQARRDEIRDSPYSDVIEYDRAIGNFREGDRGTRVAFTVTYRSDRLGDDGIVLNTIVRCNRRTNGAWSCEERELRQTALDLKRPLARDSGGEWTKTSLEALLDAVLERR